MNIQKFEPLADMERIQRGLRRVFPAWDSFPSLNEPWGIPLDIKLDSGEVEISASLPGAKKEDISIDVEDNVLTIKVESKSEQEEDTGRYILREVRKGSFHRSLRLPDVVDTEKASSSYQDGVLRITFPKEESRKARKININ